MCSFKGLVDKILEVLDFQVIKFEEGQQKLIERSVLRLLLCNASKLENLHNLGSADNPATFDEFFVDFKDLDFFLTWVLPVLFCAPLDVLEELLVCSALMKVVVLSLVGHFCKLLTDLSRLEVCRVL